MARPIYAVFGNPQTVEELKQFRSPALTYDLGYLRWHRNAREHLVGGI